MAEIKDLLIQINEKEKYELKQKYVIAYNQAYFIQGFIAKLLDNKAEIPTLFEINKELFKEELEEQKENEKKRQLALHKAKMINFAENFNAMRRKNK